VPRLVSNASSFLSAVCTGWDLSCTQRTEEARYKRTCVSQGKAWPNGFEHHSSKRDTSASIYDIDDTMGVRFMWRGNTARAMSGLAAGQHGRLMSHPRSEVSTAGELSSNRIEPCAATKRAVQVLQLIALA
jgi:hypothetical protein